MAWDVEVTDEFKVWWNGLTEAERISVERAVLLLEERGPHLPFPRYRVLYIFDPRRVALLLLGGDKTGDDRWYEKNVPLADQLYDNYLAEIEEEDDAKDDKVQ
ncbi:MAG: type II toxin-antitoxin system RelE/ParE family toxin [Acidobacteriia bacterium]|nr:type II toxin-antitoxin system RelE/ParE family toxin [Terriglobia bacterium]